MASIIFFGSFQHYSIYVLEKLRQHHTVVGVVTTPPRPAGRHLEVKSTEVAEYTKQHNLTLCELESLNEIPAVLQKPDFIVVAGYGKLIPNNWLSFPSKLAINMHPSMLPAYPGPMPGEWAILNGETMVGVTLHTMTEKFDAGQIVAQTPLEISSTDTRETFYERAFKLGADMLINTLKLDSIPTTPQPVLKSPFYARKLTREDGFVPYEQLMTDLKSQNESLIRKWRALTPWPGVWSTDPEGKRVKLLNPYTQQIQVSA